MGHLVMLKFQFFFDIAVHSGEQTLTLLPRETGPSSICAEVEPPPKILKEATESSGSFQVADSQEFHVSHNKHICDHACSNLSQVHPPPEKIPKEATGSSNSLQVAV